jgi:hypothetical protein
MWQPSHPFSAATSSFDSSTQPASVLSVFFLSESEEEGKEIQTLSLSMKEEEEEKN